MKREILLKIKNVLLFTPFVFVWLALLSLFVTSTEFAKRDIINNLFDNIGPVLILFFASCGWFGIVLLQFLRNRKNSDRFLIRELVTAFILIVDSVLIFCGYNLAIIISLLIIACIIFFEGDWYNY